MELSVPKIEDSLKQKMLSPYNFKEGRNFSLFLRFVLTIHFMANFFYLHILGKSPFLTQVGDQKSFFTQISESYISARSLTFILVELVIILLEFFVSKQTSFEWFKFYLLKNFSSEPQNRAEFYASIKKLVKEKNVHLDVSHKLIQTGPELRLACFGSTFDRDGSERIRVS